MPEKATTTSTTPAAKLPQSGLPLASGQRNMSLLRPLIWLPVAAAALLIGFYIVLAQQIGAWQMLGTAGFFVVFIALMLLANRWLKQGRLHAAGYSIMLAFAVAGGGIELMIFGFTPVTAISVPLLLILISSILLPGQWKQPLAGITLYLAYIWAINRISVFPRYDASNLTIINVISSGASAILVVIILWLFVRTYASYTLRTKLLIAFLIVSLVSVGVVVFYADRTIRLTLQERASFELINVAQLRGTAVGDLLAEEVKLLQTLALSEKTRSEAEASNAGYQGSEADTKAALLELDQTWRAAVDANHDNDPLIQAKLNNPIADYLREYQALYPENVEVVVTDRYGALLGATNRTSGYYQAAEDWWQAAYSKGSGAIYYSQPTFDENTGKFSLYIALPVYDKGRSKMLGILRTTIDLAAETAIVANVQLGKASLLFPDGSRVTEKSPTFVSSSLLAQLPVDIDRIAEMEWDGQPSFVVVAPVRSSDARLGISVGQLRWKVVAHQPRAEILAPVEAQTTTVLLVFAVIAIVVTGVSIGLSQILVRPITRLTKTAKKVAEGDLTAQATVETRDEIGALAVTFNNMTTQLSALVNSLEERVQASTEQLRTSAAVGQAAASVLDPDQLLREAVNLITDRFGFYYAAFFTLDEAGHYAVLREGTGEAGRILKERGHQLEVGGQSMVGFVTTQRRARIALDVGEEAVRFANPLLPGTRSEIALPLIVGNRVLGALDVQSTHEAAFDEANATVLQSMADQIAIALNNAEQFKQTERQAKLQASLNHLNRSLFAAESAADLYRVLATELNRIVPHDYLSLTLTQSAGAALREYVLHAETDPVVTEGLLCSPKNTLSGRAFTTRQSAFSRNLAEDANLDDVAQLAHLGFRLALSLPLIIGERVLGTLNFASKNPEAFSLESSAQFEQLSAQVAVALETQRLAQAQQNSLREMEALTRQLTGQTWAKRLSRQEEHIQYARSGLQPERPAQLPEMETAIQQLAPIAWSRSDDPDNPSPYAAILAAPILLRGEVLGALQVSEANRAREWSQDDITFIQAVADQVALALDNARLLEETERRAQRERLVAEISSRMFASNDLESIIQIAGQELGRVLRVDRAEIKIDPNLAAAPPSELAQPGDNGQSADRQA